MTDRSLRGLNYQNDLALRYRRRSSVYSKRTLDGVKSPPPQVKIARVAPANHPIRIKPTMSPKRTATVVQDIITTPQKSAMPLPRQVSAQLPKVELESRQSWKQRMLTRNNTLAGMAAFVFLFGLAASGHSLITNKQVNEQVQAMSATGGQGDGTSGDEKPDEQPINSGAVAGYKVAPELPRKLSIPKINVSARVKSLGVSNDNQLLAPKSIYDAGWYNASAKPGVDAGAVLIDGHVHGPTRPGIFANLKKLGVGDTIGVERGDGRIITYKVEKTEQVATTNFNMAKALTSVKPGKQGLNLVTCTGSYDEDGHYEDRLIVYAVQTD